MALGIAAHLVVLLWAHHDFTPVEALVVLHSSMFAHGGGLYWGVHSAPYTISPYGPVFYVLTGYLHKWGVPAYQSGRMLSFVALAVTLWLSWRILGHLTSNTFARAAGVILAASTANVLFWGTVGQTDMLACCFSVGAFAAFVSFRERQDPKLLLLSGVLVVLAVFTKQTFVAAAGAIAVTLLWESRRLAAWWIGAVSVAVGVIGVALNVITRGGYFADAILANINPYAWFKLALHAEYLILTGVGIIVTALVGARHISRRTAPLYIYAAFAAGIWLLTAPKVGSDLNYQIEMILVLAMCAACALDRLQFFPALFCGRHGWVTLLQMPLLLHIVMNVLLTARNVAERALLEPFKAAETVALKPYVERPGPLFSVHYDSLVLYRGRIDVEPLIYSLLIRAGVTDPEPVTRDLAGTRFASVILGEDVFSPSPGSDNPEALRLPPAQIEAIRNKYRLVKHVFGPNGVYVYEPR